MTEKSQRGPILCHRKPDITYPCQWEYKVIGKDPKRLKEIIIKACAPASPTIVLSNISSGGRYTSLNATLQVDSEEMRLTIFEKLQSNAEIKMVI